MEAEGLRDSRQGPCVLKIQNERQGGSLFGNVEVQCGCCWDEGERDKKCRVRLNEGAIARLCLRQLLCGQ